MVLTISSVVLAVAVMVACFRYVLDRMDHVHASLGAAFDRQREILLNLEADVTYLVKIEKQRMEVVGATERAEESLEAEVQETLAAANQQLAFRVRSFEERKAEFERSFLVKPVASEEDKRTEVA